MNGWTTGFPVLQHSRPARRPNCYRISSRSEHSSLLSSTYFSGIFGYHHF
jgi:hypothetical protein